MEANVKAIPEGASVVIPRLVWRDPAAAIDFCVDTFGAIERVRRLGPDGRVAHAMLAIVADDPQHPPILDGVLQLPHEHVVVDPVEKLLEVDVHYPSPPVLDVPLPSRTASCARRPGRKPWLCAEQVGSTIGCSTCNSNCWTKQWSTVGMPKLTGR